MTPKPHFEVSRRSLLAGAAAGAVILGADPKAWATQVGDPWSQARAIINRLAQPVSFPSRTFSVTEYGATQCSLVSSSQIWTLVPGGHLDVGAGLGSGLLQAEQSDGLSDQHAGSGLLRQLRRLHRGHQGL